MAASSLGGLAYYRQREMYKEDPNEEPTICFNSVRPRNGIFAYFICPEYGQEDHYVYCCGDDGEENCCTFWDDGGRVAGIVIAILVFIALCVVGIVLLIKFVLWPRYKKHEIEEEKRHHNPTLDNAVPLTSVMNDYNDYPDSKKEQEMQPVYRGHPGDYYKYPSVRHSYDSEPRGYESEPKRYRGSGHRSYDSEPHGYYSEHGSRHSGSRHSDKEFDRDPKRSFRDEEPPAYEPVQRGHGQRYSDFDTLGSPVAKHPPGLPPHNTAV